MIIKSPTAIDSLFNFLLLHTSLPIYEANEIIFSEKNITLEFGRQLQSFSIQISELEFNQLFHNILDQAAIRINQETPCGKGRLDSYRLQVIIPPISPFPFIQLRKVNPKVSEWEYYLSNGWGSKKQIHLIKDIVFNKKNILLVGPTGCGKTTLLNTILREVPADERIVIIEDTEELSCPNTLSINLLSRYDKYSQLQNYTLSDLIVEALRLRPDRIVVGEVRGAEAKDLLLALSSGHSGSLCTIHAKSALEALNRLEILTLMGAPTWSREIVRQTIGLSIDYIITIGIKNNKRCLQSISKLMGVNSQHFILEEDDLSQHWNLPQSLKSIPM